MEAELKGLKLGMITKFQMKDRKKVGDNWVDTGRMINKFRYYFTDITGQMIQFVTGEDKDFSAFEGETVNLKLNVTYREFKGIGEVRTTLVGLEKA